MAYGLPLVAIPVEVAASILLKASAGFSRPLPAFTALAGFGLSLWLLSRVSAVLPISFTYAAWAGLGIIGATIGGMVVFGETVSAMHWVGIVIVAAGIVVLSIANHGAPP